MTIVDPSNFDASNNHGTVGGKGIKVICFTPQIKEWLPSPEEGDAVILRNLKVGLILSTVDFPEPPSTQVGPENK